MVRYGLKEFEAELESDLSTRHAELMTVKRAIEGAQEASDDITAAALRRAFVLLAYAHAEGGARIALASYVRLVNDLSLAVDDCNERIVASSWANVFQELTDSGPKPRLLFKGDTGGDPKLHSHARRGNFILKIRTLSADIVQIPDAAVNTESNMDQVVLSKLLFQLGLPRDWDWDRAFGDLVFLKKLRNKIAHGEIVSVSEDQCARCEKACLDANRRLRGYLERAIESESYRRAESNTPSA